MIDCSKFQNACQCEAEFLAQFASESLLGCFAFFNAASWGPVEDKTGLRILNFSDQECAAMPDETQGRLSGFDFHVLLASDSFYDSDQAGGKTRACKSVVHTQNR